MDTALTVPDPEDRSDLGSFVGRVVRLEPSATVLLRAGTGGGTDRGPTTVTAWATTPFDVLATRTAAGTVEPAEVVVSAQGLLTALSVERAATVDPGAGGLWPADTPPTGGWTAVEDIPAAEVEGLTERGLAMARQNAGPLGPPASLLDQVVLTVSPSGTGGAGVRGTVKVPLRCLFALSGMGFLGPAGGADPVRVSATGTWLRLDARYGAVARRRTTSLPLLVT